jgi:hypothetical protein
MTRAYRHIIPVRFTDSQLAQIDARAAELNIHRSTLIRKNALQVIATVAHSQHPGADSDQVSTFEIREDRIML